MSKNGKNVLHFCYMIIYINNEDILGIYIKEDS